MFYDLFSNETQNKKRSENKSARLNASDLLNQTHDPEIDFDDDESKSTILT